MKPLTLNFIWGIRRKMRAEADKMRAEGDKIWAEAILEVHGNITLEWEYVSDKDNYNCILETGEKFEC